MVPLESGTVNRSKLINGGRLNPLKFDKMHGLGNDFIIMEAFQGDYSLAAKKLCHRRYGIGGDGLVIYSKETKADYRMRIFNSDGSEAEMCGNAIRCLGKYLAEHNEHNQAKLTIETNAGSKELELIRDSNERNSTNALVTAVRVNMGTPILESSKIPVTGENRLVKSEPLETSRGTFYFTAVSTGPPHAIIFVEELLNESDLVELGREIETHPLFPQKTNVEFVKVQSINKLDVQVWERGAGRTLACGTGACAVLVASVLNGCTNRGAVVTLPGGDLNILWDKNSDRVYMTGPAEHVCTGEIILSNN